MENIVQKLFGTMVLLLLCMGLLLVLLGLQVFSPKPVAQEVPTEEPVFICGNAFNQIDETGNGYQLFKANCARCHNLSEAKLVGPGLGGVYERVPAPSEKWLRAFISNADSLYKTGDPYQKQLRKTFKKQKYQGYYHIHFTFTEQEWADLLALLKGG